MTIVVGYVPTEEGRAALRLAADEAVLRKSPLVVVSSRDAAEPTTVQAIKAYEAALDDARRTLEDQLNAEFADARRRLDEAGVTYEVRPIASGSDPSSDLTLVAEELDADFIVIGMRRRTAVGKLLLGSNAQRILLDAPCPVIAVHATPPN